MQAPVSVQVKTHPVAAILEEANEDDCHDHHYCHHDESINQGKEECLASTACLVLVEWRVHTVTNTILLTKYKVLLFTNSTKVLTQSIICTTVHH